jgi:hypothetical protein
MLRKVITTNTQFLDSQTTWAAHRMKYTAYRQICMQPVIGTTTLRPSPTKVCSLCTVVRPYMHPFRTCMGFIPVCSQALGELRKPPI